MASGMVTATEQTGSKQKAHGKQTGRTINSLLPCLLLHPPPIVPVVGTRGDTGKAEMLFVKPQPQHHKAKCIEG